MKKLNIGIIGCGIAARELHLPALLKLRDRFNIAVVCCRTESAAAGFARLAGAAYETDYRKVLARQDLEAVDIALPIYLNYRVTREALEAGKHVIVEKPLAANLTEARKMLGLASGRGRVAMLAENFRYMPVFARVAGLLSRGAVGKPYAAMRDVFYYVTRKNSKYARTKWRENPKHEGAFIADGGVHHIAALRSMFGDFTRFRAFSKSVNPQIGRPDTFCLQFDSASGVSGVFNMFFSANGFYADTLKIFGSAGTLFLEGKRITVRRDGRPDAVETVRTHDEGGFMAEFTDFHRAVTTDSRPKSSFREGYRDLEIILKAIAS